MATTATLLMPYPALSAAANVPADMQALADRIEALLTGEYGVPGMIRVKNPTAATSFGAGVHTMMTGWTQDYVKGPSGLFTLATGAVTCVTSGLYLMVFNFSGSAGSAAGTISLRDFPGTGIYTRSTWPAGNSVAAAHTVRYLAAGERVGAWVYNGSGTMTIDADAAGTPCAYTVTRLAAST